MFNRIIQKFQKLPSFIQILLIPIGLFVFIGSIIWVFVLLGTVEGFATLIILTAGVLTLPNVIEFKSPNLKTAVVIFIGFFALMGATIDQTGNYILNKPVEIIFCEEGTQLERDVEVLHPTPGRTDMIQEFSCVDSDGETQLGINVLLVMLIRFFEYVLIGYGILYGVRYYKGKG